MVEAVAFLVEVAFPAVEVAFQAVTRQRLVAAVVLGSGGYSMVLPVEVAVAPPLTPNYEMHLLAVQQQLSFFCLFGLVLGSGPSPEEAAPEAAFVRSIAREDSAPDANCTIHPQLNAGLKQPMFYFEKQTQF